MYPIIVRLVTAWCHLTYHIRIEGKENLPEEGGRVYASNHMSYLDPVLLGILRPKHRFSYVAKEELFKNRLFAGLIRWLGAFPVSRGSGDMSVIDESTKRLRAGRNLVIFPEGTRSKDGRVGRGKTGVALIAAQAGVDVVPVGLTYTPKLHFRSRIIIRVGKPIPAAELKLGENPRPKDMTERKNRIMSAIRSLVDEPPAAEAVVEKGIEGSRAE